VIDRLPFLGVPYATANCLQLALLVQEQLGHQIPDVLGLDPKDPAVPTSWWEHWAALDVGDREVGTVLVVRGDPLGVGTVLGPREVLTTDPPRGCHVQDLRTFVRPGVVGAWRPA